MLLHAVNLNNLSLSASLFLSLCLQYGCTALQTARGKRPQVALCVYVNMSSMHALLCVRAQSCTLFDFLIFFKCSSENLLSMFYHLPLLPPICSNPSQLHYFFDFYRSLSVDLCGAGWPTQHWLKMRCQVWFFSWSSTCRWLPMTSLTSGCTALEWCVKREGMVLKSASIRKSSALSR